MRRERNTLVCGGGRCVCCARACAPRPAPPDWRQRLQQQQQQQQQQQHERDAWPINHALHRPLAAGAQLTLWAFAHSRARHLSLSVCLAGWLRAGRAASGAPRRNPRATGARSARNMILPAARISGARHSGGRSEALWAPGARGEPELAPCAREPVGPQFVSREQARARIECGAGRQLARCSPLNGSGRTSFGRPDCLIEWGADICVNWVERRASGATPLLLGQQTNWSSWVSGRVETNERRPPSKRALV